MHVRRLLSFFRNAGRRVVENKTVRFLFFVEDVPKHRVMESINILLLTSLSIVCFFAGLGGFMLWAAYGLAGFMLYYLLALVGLLELLHCLFDR